jgi:hypothetical protein
MCCNKGDKELQRQGERERASTPKKRKRENFNAPEKELQHQGERKSDGHGKGERFDKGERERAMARERARAPLGHFTTKWRERV